MDWADELKETIRDCVRVVDDKETAHSPSLRYSAIEDNKGYLGFYGLIDWYNSLPPDFRERVLKCHKKDTSSDIDLLTGSLYCTSRSALNFLMGLAYSAAELKDMQLSNMIMNESFKFIQSKDDGEFCNGTARRILDLNNLPNERDIEGYKYKVLLKIKEQPGILQSEIRKLFNKSESTLVGYALSRLNHAGIIQREKKGRSFVLYIKEKEG